MFSPDLGLGNPDAFLKSFTKTVVSTEFELAAVLSISGEPDAE
jgi:hypothetical protein